jgi:hypothetical protein
MPSHLDERSIAALRAAAKFPRRVDLRAEAAADARLYTAASVLRQNAEEMRSMIRVALSAAKYT